MRKTPFIAGAAFALYAAAGAAAFAQTPPPGAQPPARGARPDMPGGPQDLRNPRGMRPDFRAERRDPAEHLKAMLQLKPAQEPALTAFLAAMKPREPQMQPANTPMPKTTPERLALADRRLTERTAEAHAKLDATRRFYDQLDAGQKRAFDELGPMMMGGPMGGMGSHRVMMRHMQMPPMSPMAPPPPKS